MCRAVCNVKALVGLLRTLRCCRTRKKKQLAGTPFLEDGEKGKLMHTSEGTRTHSHRRASFWRDRGVQESKTEK